MVSLPRATDPVLISQRLEARAEITGSRKNNLLKENCLSQPEIYESAVTVGGEIVTMPPGYCIDWLTPWIKAQQTVLFEMKNPYGLG